MMRESGIAPLPGVEAAADWVIRLTRMQRECHGRVGCSMPRGGDGMAQSGDAGGRDGGCGWNVETCLSLCDSIPFPGNATRLSLLPLGNWLRNANATADRLSNWFDAVSR